MGWRGRWTPGAGPWPAAAQLQRQAPRSLRTFNVEGSPPCTHTHAHAHTHTHTRVPTCTRTLVHACAFPSLKAGSGCGAAPRVGDPGSSVYGGRWAVFPPRRGWVWGQCVCGVLTSLRATGPQHPPLQLTSSAGPSPLASGLWRGAGTGAGGCLKPQGGVLRMHTHRDGFRSEIPYTELVTGMVQWLLWGGCWGGQRDMGPDFGRRRRGRGGGSAQCPCSGLGGVQQPRAHPRHPVLPVGHGARRCFGARAARSAPRLARRSQVGREPGLGRVRVGRAGRRVRGALGAAGCQPVGQGGLRGREGP